MLRLKKWEFIVAVLIACMVGFAFGLFTGKVLL